MFAYSCFIVILLFSSILQLELFRTHNNQIYEVDALLEVLFQPPNSTSFTGFPVKTENRWLYISWIAIVMRTEYNL